VAGLFGVSRLLDSAEKERQHLRATVAAEALAARIDQYIAARVAAMQLMRDDWRRGDLGTPAQFKIEARRVAEVFPGFQAIIFINEKGVIRTVAPLEGNEAALGADLSRHPVAGPRLARARRLGLDVTAIPPVVLLQGGNGFVVYFPLRHRGRLRGYLGAVFRTNVLVRTAIDDVLRRDYDIRITDGPAIVYSATKARSALSNAGMSRARIADRVWEIRLASKGAPTAPGLIRQVGVPDGGPLLYGKILVAIGVVLTLALGFAVRAVLARHLSLRRREQQASEFGRILIDAAKSEALASGDLDRFVREITRIAAGTLGTRYASVWLYDEQRSRMECLDCFDCDTGEHCRRPARDRMGHASYFAALETNRTIAVSDAQSDPRTAELNDDCLVPREVTSIIDVPIFVAGEVVGVVSHEHAGSARHWTGQETNFAASIGDLVALAIQAQRRRDAERAHREQRTLFERMIANIPDALMLADSDRKLILCNPGVEHVFGYAPQELIGQSTRVLYPSDEPYRQLGRERFNVAAEEQPKPYVVQYQHKDGHVFPGETIGTVLRDDNGEVLGFIGLIRDVTEREEAANALQHSEQRFRDFANAACDFYWELDESLCFSYISRRFSELTGENDQDLIGKSRADARMPGLSDAEWHDFLADLVAHRPVRNLILSRHHAKKGHTVWLSINAVPIFDADGRFEGYRGTGTDITERRLAVEEARENEALFRTLMHNMRNIVFCRGLQGSGRYHYDDDGIFIYGRDAQEIAGTVEGGKANVDLWYSSIVPEDRKRYAELEDRRKKEDKDYVLEYRIKHPVTGQLRWMRETAWVVKLEDTGRTIYDSYIIDITDEKLVEERLRAAREEAELASRAKSEFLANMSHELRTPLNAVLGFSEVMLQETFGKLGSKTYVEYANAIHESGAHLLSLINDILDLSKIEAGKFELDERPVGIEEIVVACVRLIHERAEAAGLTIDQNLDRALPLVRADERVVKQVLLNLLSNAVKFTPDGGRVTISAGLDDHGRLRISVTDTGIGIAKADIPRVLTPFEQVAGSLTRTHQGSGLGLPLVKSMIELHGGEIEIESSPGKGTTVTAIFPADRVMRGPSKAAKISAS
jgi:PAS domain S-box-containing protein